MWHACGPYSVEEFLEGKGDRARELFDGFERPIAACGPYEVAPAKTRVAFMGRVRFAGVNNISDRGMTIAFGLPRALRHPRIRKIDGYGGGWYGHWMRITSPAELDDELLGWLRESHHQMGMQERQEKRTLWGGEHDPTTMWKVWELVRKSGVPIDSNQRRRFRPALNDRAMAGEEARYDVSVHYPVESDSMSLKKAESFLGGVLAEWFNAR